MQIRTDKVGRIEALGWLVSRLTAPDLTLPESRALRRQLVAVLGRADLDGESTPTLTPRSTEGDPRSGRRTLGSALCCANR